MKPDEKGLYLTIFNLFYATVATFLSGYTTISNFAKFVWLIVLTVLEDRLLYLFYGYGLLAPILVTSLIFIIICALIILKKEKDTVGRIRLDILIRKFTKNADTNSPIKIFGGDLNFFGKVADRKNSVYKNKQYNQIKKMGFRNIQILCRKPKYEYKEDEGEKLLIGLLLTELQEKVSIRFYNDTECYECDTIDCTILEICNECEKSDDCAKPKVSCDKFKNKLKNYCYNPDLDIRGRIVTKSKTGAEMGIITIKDNPGKTYILKVYNADTKECTMYKQIWNVWWGRGNEDEKLLHKCKKYYGNYKNGHPKKESKSIYEKLKNIRIRL